MNKTEIEMMEIIDERLADMENKIGEVQKGFSDVHHELSSLNDKLDSLMALMSNYSKAVKEDIMDMRKEVERIKNPQLKIMNGKH